MHNLLASMFFLCVFCNVSAAQNYFPWDAWHDPVTEAPWLGDWIFLEGWYGGQLRAMQEEPLVDAEVPPGLTVRLLFLPTFDPASALRVTLAESGHTSFSFTQLDGAGGYAPGNIATVYAGNVPGSIRRSIEALTTQLDPWNAPYREPESYCLDGTMIVLEFRTPGAYRAFERHNCDLGPNEPMRTLVWVMHSLSNEQMIPPGRFDPLQEN